MQSSKKNTILLSFTRIYLACLSPGVTCGLPDSGSVAAAAYLLEGNDTPLKLRATKGGEVNADTAGNSAKICIASVLGIILSRRQQQRTSSFFRLLHSFFTASSSAVCCVVVRFVCLIFLYPMCANLVPIKYIPNICQMSNVFRESSDFCASSYTFANRSAFMITSTEDSQRDFG